MKRLNIQDIKYLQDVLDNMVWSDDDKDNKNYYNELIEKLQTEIELIEKEIEKMGV